MVSDREQQEIDHFVKSLARSSPKRIEAELLWAKKCLNNARNWQGRTYWRTRYDALEKLLNEVLNGDT